MRLSASFLAVSLFAAACGPAPDLGAESGDEVSTATALRARAGETTFWVDPLIKRRVSTDRTSLVISGRTSRNITDGFGFVFDDPYGEVQTPSARTFTVSYSPTELTSLVVGVQQFIRLSFTPSAGRPETLTARVLVAPALSGFAGSGLFIDAKTPVVSVGGRPVMQITGRSDRDLRGLRVSAGDVAIPDFRLDGPRRFVVHLPMDHVIALAGSTSRLIITGVAARSTITKSSKLDLVIGSLELTGGDAYEVWPNLPCAPAVAQCVQALPSGSVELGSCGSYLETQRCASAVFIVDDVSLTAALARASQRLTAIGLERDASGLVGAARAASFTDNVFRTIESRFEALFGQGYRTAAMRDAALDAEAEDVFDTAYARPLDFVEALEPLAGDAARARDVAADALLGYLATHDLRETEWARPLEVLAREFRARHVESVRDFREVGEIISSSAVRDILGGRWLDAHVEITVEKATGAVTSVFFEVD